MELPCCLMTPFMVGKNLKTIRGQVISATISGGGILLEAHVLEGDIQEDRNARSVPPVPLEVSANGELRHNVDTGIPHPSVSKVGSAGVKGTGSVGVGEDGVTGLKQRQGSERRADLWSFAP